VSPPARRRRCWRPGRGLVAALALAAVILAAASADARKAPAADVLDGGEAAARLNAASAALKAKRFEEALRDYRLVARHAPAADMKKFAREGVAHTLASRAATHADSLVKAGRLADARDSLRLALRLSPANELRATLKTRSANLEARVLLEEAAAHRKAGDAKRARAALDKAARLAVDSRMLEFIRARMQELADADATR